MKKEKLIKEIDRLVKELSQEVVKSIVGGKFSLVKYNEYTAVILLDKINIELDIWMANNEDSNRFYANTDRVYSCILSMFGDIPENQRKKVRDVIKKKIANWEQEKGLERPIEKKQLSNDLFFSFKGIYDTIKFTGYDDNDWWSEFKSTEIKEDENITWIIDLDKMVALYKKRIK